MTGSGAHGLLLAALALSTAPAHAEDPRLITLPYRGDVVERVEGHAGVEASIAFGEDEHIENVAIGDGEAWQVTPNKRVNMLFVKPLRPRARTNLTVVTDLHSYFFDLVASPEAKPVYLLRFHYPDAPKPASAPPPLTKEEVAIASGTVAPIDPADLDFGWRIKGKASLSPVRVFDDGRDTYLGWPEHTALPAILITDAKGTEGPVNFSMKGALIVVEGVPPRITLRSGKDMAVIEHTGEPARPVRAAAQTATVPPPAVTSAATPLAASAPIRGDTP